MIEFNITSNIKEIQKKLSAVANQQLPFAIAMGLNDTVRDTRAAVQKTMSKVFDRPVSRTINSVKIKTGTKAKPEASIWIDGEPGKGIAAAQYLSAEILGGQRRQKRFERALQAKGLMPAGSFAVPASGAPTDASGNIPGGFLVQLLSYFGAFVEQGYRANMTQKRKAKMHGMKRSPGGFKTIGGAMYFIANGRGKSSHFAPGIYKKTGIHGVDVQPVILFVRAANYGVRFRFDKIVRDAVNERFAVRLNERLERALATAK